jgi:hypothetical protein
MIDASQLADLLVEAHRSRTACDFGIADVKQWILAIENLVARREFDSALHAVTLLSRRFPNVEYLRTMTLLLRKLPPISGDPSFDQFRDDPSRDVQIVHRTGAKTVIFAFAGTSGRLGLPLQMMHRWFGRVDVHVVYLRDRARQLYNEGIASLANDVQRSAELLSEIADDLKANHVCCYGNSVGGFGALRYSLIMRARAALVFSAPTNLTEAFCGASGLAKLRIKIGPDLRLLFLQSPEPPRGRLIYCEDQAEDSRQAENLRGLPTVWLDPIAGSSNHNAFLHSVEQDELEGQLNHLIRVDSFYRCPV